MADVTDTVVYVTYQGTPDTRFDRVYYVERHLPLVMEAWEAHGLKGVAAFFPAVAEAGTIAVCECRFRDEAASGRGHSTPPQGCFSGAPHVINTRGPRRAPNASGRTP